MDGEQALTFVRQRKQFADGDFQRNRNQQAVLQGIADKLISADTLTDPRKLRDTIDAVSPYLTTDDGLSSTAMVELGLSLRSVRDRKSTRLNSSHVAISYAVFCLKKKKNEETRQKVSLLKHK